MSRILRYSVAASLDGFIADAHGGFSWIPADPDVDFGAMFAQYDTLVMGRHTYDAARSAGPDGLALWAQHRIVVCSTTLDPAEHPDVEVFGTDVDARVRALKQDAGKDIWLFGGGVLFRRLLEAGLVDEVEVAIVPILLGRGIPLLPGSSRPTTLRHLSHHHYVASGMHLVRYAVD
jgi:dihydrofolate reductase